MVNFIITNKEIVNTIFEKELKLNGCSLYYNTGISFKEIVLNDVRILIFGAPYTLSINGLNNISNYDVDNFKILGHYIIIKIYNDKIEIINDKYNLKPLYYFQDDIIFAFSNNINLLDEQIGIEINEQIMMDFYHYGKSITSKSYLTNTVKHDNNKYYIINNFKVELNGVKFHNYKLYNKNDVEDFINSFPYLISNDNISNVSVSLSGGVDSRSLLRYYKFSSHCYDHNDEDTKFAKMVCNHLGLPIKVYPFKKYGIKDISFYHSNHYNFDKPLTSLLILSDSTYYGQSKINIDAGFAEYIRNEFFKKIIIYNKFYLLNAEKLLHELSLNKPNIFKEELTDIYNASKKNKVELLRRNYFENKFKFSDFVINYKVKGLYSLEQNRLDDFKINHTLFLQSIVLDNISVFKEFYNFNNVTPKIPYTKNDIIYFRKISFYIKRYFSGNKKSHMIDSIILDKKYINELYEKSRYTHLLSKESKSIIEKYIMNQISDLNILNYLIPIILK